MDNRSILISVKEIYAQQIVIGRKRVELRKSFPTSKEGSRVYIYIPAPNKKIIGYFDIEKINKMPLATLWKVAGHLAALSRDDFFAYFSGKEFGISIHFNKFNLFNTSLSLNFIKQNLPKFHPPQSYIYLDKKIEDIFLEKAKYSCPFSKNKTTTIDATPNQLQ